MNKTIAQLLIAVSVLAFANTARAGLITVDQTDFQQMASHKFEPSSGEMPADDEQPQQKPSTPAESHAQVGLTGHNGSTGTSGGTSSSTSSNSVSFVADLVTEPACANGELSRLLGPEGRVWLPPPFSTGVFRPPRIA